MTEEAPKPKMTDRDKAEMIIKMTKEAQRVERRTGAESCVVICIFKDGTQLTFQDAGRFPMPPEDFYRVMSNSHAQDLMGQKPKSRIIKPH